MRVIRIFLLKFFEWSGRLLAAAGTAEFEREGKEARIYFQKEDSMTATQSMYQSRPRDEDNNIDKVCSTCDVGGGKVWREVCLLC